MNGDKRQARRYHWHSEGLASFVEEPHSAIDGPEQGHIINLTGRRAAPSHSAQLDLLGTLGPAGILDEYEVLTRQASAQAQLPHLVKPSHHDVRAKDVFTRRREERARCAGGALDGAASALGDGYQDGR